MGKRKAIRSLLVCVIELGLLGLAFWQIALYGTGASQAQSLAAALDFSPEEVQCIEVRHAGAEEQAWVLEDPAEAREAAEYLAVFPLHQSRGGGQPFRLGGPGGDHHLRRDLLFGTVSQRR